MRFTFLGTGDVQQVPVFGCDCRVCQRARQQPAYQRASASALIECNGETTLLDAGLVHPERRFHPGELSRILLTHYHMDHVQGLFTLRWGMGARIPVFGPPDEQGCDDLYRHPGLLDFQPLPAPFQPLACGDFTLTPLPLIHSKLTYGYLIRYGDWQLAYLTDTVGLPPQTLRFLQHRRLDVLVLDCSHSPQAQRPRNHNDITLALQLHEQLRPQFSWLTHISHQVDDWLLQNALPANVKPAHDGLTLLAG